MKKTLSKLTYFVIIAIIVMITIVFLLVKELVIPTKSEFVLESQRVLVLDPGHGGEDGGAVSLSGMHESVLNLDIAKRIDAIMGLFGTEVVMTRDEEELI